MQINTNERFVNGLLKTCRPAHLSKYFNTQYVIILLYEFIVPIPMNSISMIKLIVNYSLYIYKIIKLKEARSLEASKLQLPNQQSINQSIALYYLDTRVQSDGGCFESFSPFK